MSEAVAESTEEEVGELNEGLDALHSPEGELVQPDDDEAAVAPEPEPELEREGRCEAQTSVGGTLYHCALNVMHEGEHSFQPRDTATPPAEETEKTMRDLGTRLDNENERHWKRINEIMGADAQQLVPCELCFIKTPGYRWDAAPNAETTARVRVVIGMPDLSNYRPSSTETVCDTCNGLGKVRTGSAVAQFETANCDPCQGKGFVATRERTQTVALDAPAEADKNGQGHWHDDGTERDMFGTPITDPDYGKMPNMRARPVDYWQTHRE